MTLQNTDLFYVQRGASGHKIEYKDFGFLQLTGGALSGTVTGDETSIGATWDLSASNFFTCGAVAIPTPTNGVKAQSGVIRFSDVPTSFPAETILPDGFNITGACVVPYYVVAADRILLGNPVEVS